jgi:hypothetical protein
MITPRVTELPRRCEAVVHDPFIDRLDEHPQSAASAAQAGTAKGAAIAYAPAPLTA